VFWRRSGELQRLWPVIGGYDILNYHTWVSLCIGFIQLVPTWSVCHVIIVFALFTPISATNRASHRGRSRTRTRDPPLSLIPCCELSCLCQFCSLIWRIQCPSETDRSVGDNTPFPSPLDITMTITSHNIQHNIYPGLAATGWLTDLYSFHSKAPEPQPRSAPYR
jgi:hypothetical protein